MGEETAEPQRHEGHEEKKPLGQKKQWRQNEHKGKMQ
jgi:hypothetical protein